MGVIVGQGIQLGAWNLGAQAVPGLAELGLVLMQRIEPVMPHTLMQDHTRNGGAFTLTGPDLDGVGEDDGVAGVIIEERLCLLHLSHLFSGEAVLGGVVASQQLGRIGDKGQLRPHDTGELLVEQAGRALSDGAGVFDEGVERDTGHEALAFLKARRSLRMWGQGRCSLLRLSPSPRIQGWNGRPWCPFIFDHKAVERFNRRGGALRGQPSLNLTEVGHAAFPVSDHCVHLTIGVASQIECLASLGIVGLDVVVGDCCRHSKCSGGFVGLTDPLTPRPRSTSRANSTRTPQKQFPSRH